MFGIFFAFNWFSHNSILLTNIIEINLKMIIVMYFFMLSTSFISIFITKSYKI